MISSSVKALVIEPESHRADHLLALMDPSAEPRIEAEIVDSLSSGLKRFSEGAWDVVVTRLRLPDAKGLEALVRFHLVSREVPVIVILEDEEQEVVLDAVQSLAEDCLFWNDLDSNSLCHSVIYSIDRREMLHELHSRQNAQSASLNKTPYKALLNRIDEALFLISVEDGSVLFANDVAKAWFDKGVDEMVRDLLEYRILDGDEIEMEITTRTPSIPSAELRSICMEWKGKPTCMVTLRNISKRKRAEEAFLASQRRLELALKASNIGLWSWELRSNQIRFTERWKALLGYSSFEFPDTLTAFRDHLHPEDRERVINRFRKFLRQPWPDFECEYRLRHKDGDYRDVICRAEIFADKEGQLSKMVGSQIDITERKRLEQARFDFEKQLRDT
ncbi:MAG: PAS domain-containing protein, partial [Verrucomicrobiota bacterium]